MRCLCGYSFERCGAESSLSAPSSFRFSGHSVCSCVSSGFRRVMGGRRGSSFQCESYQVAQVAPIIWRVAPSLQLFLSEMANKKHKCEVQEVLGSVSVFRCHAARSKKKKVKEINKKETGGVICAFFHEASHGRLIVQRKIGVGLPPYPCLCS